jgi:hypothetical protein
MAVARQIDTKPTIGSELSLGEPLGPGGSSLCFGNPISYLPSSGPG